MPPKGDSAEFSKIDQTSDPRYFIEFLDARKTIAGEREIKQLVLDLLDLRLGEHVLDVGCGTGDDAREIAGLVGATGRVVGIDSSEVMVTEAKRRVPTSVGHLEFRTGDARKLDFPDSSFDAVRTDRVLIWVPEVENVLSEIFRVLRPGGRLVTSELDAEAYFADSPMVEFSREVFAVLAQTGGVANSRLGRQLLRLVTQAGFRNVKSIPQIIRPSYQMFRRIFDQTLRSLIEKRRLPEEEVTRWLEGLAQAEAAAIFNVCNIVFTVYGEKP
jgi:ubiquinone/menaquinone biosynthesis C-methylase UbiE